MTSENRCTRAVGHVIHRARYYNPSNGRFSARDSFLGNTFDPQSLHKYAYAHCDPINGIDPSGHEYNLNTLQIATLIAVTINVYYSSQAYRRGEYVKGTLLLIAAGFGVFGLFGNALPPTYALATTTVGELRTVATISSGFSKLLSATSIGTAFFNLAGEDHHIMTDKNKKSSAPDGAGPYTPKFEELLRGTGIRFNDAINRVRVVGHRGPHPAANRYTYQVLEKSVRGLTRGSKEYTEAIQKALEKLSVEAQTPGTPLNTMLTAQ